MNFIQYAFYVNFVKKKKKNIIKTASKYNVKYYIKIVLKIVHWSTNLHKI